MNEVKTVAELRQTQADAEKAIQSILDHFEDATGYKLWIVQDTKYDKDGKLVDVVRATLRAKL